MAGALLRSGTLAEFNALGAVGNAVYTSSAQLRTTVRRLLGPEMADLLARPQPNEAGNLVDWYAPFDGVVVPWSAADPDERERARTTLQDARDRYLRRSGEILAEAGGRPAAAGSGPAVFGRLLPLALQIPDESHIYLVDGRPVVTFWGFTRLDAPPERDVIRDLSPPPPPPPPPPPAAPAAVTAPPGPGWWRWLWLLVPLLLLAALLVGMRACQGVAPLPLPWQAAPPAVPLPAEPPGADRPAAVPPETAVPRATVPVPAVPSPAVPGPAVPDAAVPGLAVPGAVVPEGAAPTVDPMPPAAVPEPAPAPSPDAAPVPPPVAVPEPGSPPAPPVPVPSDPGAAAGTPPGLTLPADALRDGTVDFLDGHWRSRTGLMDSATGQPIEVEYDFQAGRGTSTIRRSDGVACTAPSTAAMQGGLLVIEQTANPVCADGQVFNRSRVECRPGRDGRADCRGRNADGTGYVVEIAK